MSTRFPAKCLKTSAAHMREKDVAELVVRGLIISEGTVRNTLSVVLDKLELRDRTQLALFYWRRL